MAVRTAMTQIRRECALEKPVAWAVWRAANPHALEAQKVRPGLEPESACPLPPCSISRGVEFIRPQGVQRNIHAQFNGLFSGRQMITAQHQAGCVRPSHVQKSRSLRLRVTA